VQNSELKKRVAVIDYGMGNLYSVKKSCEHVGLTAILTSLREEIETSDAIILPGVGAFGDAMKNLKNLGLVDVLISAIESGKLFMGICLGFQLLMTESDEFGVHRGLNVISGKVVRFPSEKRKVPQVGWNKIFPLVSVNWHPTILANVPQGSEMYFVHSYFVVPQDKNIQLATTIYEGVEYCSAISQKNIFACQFHPEKSGNTGLKVYRNFAQKVLGLKRGEQDE